MTDQSQNYPFVPATQSIALNATNVFEGGNDRQLAACYTEATRSRIAADAERLARYWWRAPLINTRCIADEVNPGSPSQYVAGPPV